MPDFRVYVAMDLKAKTPLEAVQIATAQLEYMLDVSNDDEACRAVFIGSSSFSVESDKSSLRPG